MCVLVTVNKCFLSFITGHEEYNSKYGLFYKRFNRFNSPLACTAEMRVSERIFFD